MNLLTICCPAGKYAKTQQTKPFGPIFFAQTLPIIIRSGPELKDLGNLTCKALIDDL